jgi:hypothetical protein
LILAEVEDWSVGLAFRLSWLLIELKLERTLLRLSHRLFSLYLIVISGFILVRILVSLSIHRVHRQRMLLLHFRIYRSYLVFDYFLFFGSCLTRLKNLKKLFKSAHIPVGLDVLNSGTLELLLYLILFLLLFLILYLLPLVAKIVRWSW